MMVVDQPEAELAVRFPRLFTAQRWEWAQSDAQFSIATAPDALVTNVHVVGFAGDRVVVCRDARGVWFLPGGTRERGESIVECAGRELREEAGARLRGPLTWLGAHHCVSEFPKPYRPWHPHPEKYWLWCAAEVQLDGAPTNPTDGERILEVRTAPAAEAKRLLTTDADWLPDLVDLALMARAEGGNPR